MSNSFMSVLLTIGVCIGGEGRRLLCSAKQGGGLVHSLLIFRFRIAVGNYAAGGLNMQYPVLEYGRAERDTGMEPPVRAEIADRAAIDAAPGSFQLVDDFHRPDLGRTAD